MTLNPNYPAIEELWGPSWTAAGASLPAQRWVNMVDRTLSAASARRGKQYELDQPQAGEYGIVLGSQDGALDPTNSAGPFGGKILPYQPYRRRAQWPPTPNLLDAVIATGGEGFTAGSLPASFNLTLPTAGITGSIAVLGSNAWQGVNAFSFAVPSGVAAGSGIFRTDTVAIRPGKKFTFSLYVANTTASTSTNVTAYVSFLAADGTATLGQSTSVTLAGAASPAWQRVTVTATAPTTGPVFGLRIGLNVGATTAAASTVVVDGMQGEWGSAATAFTAPGTWYPLFSGFTERWPSAWVESGSYGQVSPTAVDAFALLSQVTLGEVFPEEIQSHAPRFSYSLGDGAGATSFADSTGAQPLAPTLNSKAGSGNWTSGNAITSASPTGAYTGSTGTVVTSSPLSPGSATPGAATVLSLTDAGIAGPGSPAWTRMVAFRWVNGTAPTDIAVIWESRQNDLSFGSHVKLYINASGSLVLLANANGQDPTFSRTTLAAGMADGNWHLVTFGFDTVGNVLRYAVDGVATTSGYSLPPNSVAYADYVGATYFPSTRIAIDVFKGDLAYVTEFPSLLSESDMGQLYSTWRTSAVGESSAARYSRILRYAGYTGASNVGAGLTSSMGPANDLAGSDAMSALNNVATTENGEHFVAGDGTVVFRGRNARYNAITPALTLGDGPGEIPYEDLQLDFDSTHLSNVVAVTQQMTGTTFTAQDSASIASYYTRTMTRTLNTTSGPECADAADYLVNRYKGPLTRVQSLKLHPSAVPALWPSLLSLELGTRVRINRRPPGAPLISIECFVEQISWDMDDKGEAWLTLQCSPADSSPYTGFAAWHTTLNTTALAGVTSVIVNAPADNTNPLRSQLSVGSQLVLGPGTANQETVTVAGVSGTSAGWSSALVGLASATTKNHSAGDVICDVLPPGVSDPTFFDSIVPFGNATFAY